MPYTRVEQTHTNKTRVVWGAQEVLIQQIGLGITHNKQSKLYLLPWEPEILTAKRLMVELLLHLYLINLRER